MASCLVPDIPAVMVALEHLKELDKQLKEDGIPFSSEASHHLTEITAAVTELEAERRAAHEHLEVVTIENSKIRHQTNNIRERITQEIMADIVAARASNAEEIEQLHKDLNAASQLQEASRKEQEALSLQNSLLGPVREKVRAIHEEVVAKLNDQITLKYSLQIALDEMKERIEELRAHVAAVELDISALQQDMALAREAFNAKEKELSREVDQAYEKVKQKKQAIRSSRKELEKVEGRKKEVNDRLGELTLDMSKLEYEMQRLRATRDQCEKQLEAEIKKHGELKQQREKFKKQFHELVEAFSAAIKLLEEEIDAMEGKIEEDQESGLVCKGALDQIYEIFKSQCDEENDVRTEHSQVFQELQQSKLRLETRIASIVRQRKEIKEIYKLIGELLETETITKRVMDRNQEEIFGSVNTEIQNIVLFKEKLLRLKALLEESKRKQVEYVTEMSADIGSAKKRYQELQEEQAALLHRQPLSQDPDSLQSHVTQCEAEYKQIESECQQEIEQCIASAEVVARGNVEKLLELEEKEERLKEVEADCSQEETRYQTVKVMTVNLRRKRNTLELSIQHLQEDTISLLRPKEDMKAELEMLRGTYLDQLDKQAVELRAVEMSVYDHSVKLEQVGMENSRLHLRVRQLTEDVSKTSEDTDRYRQEIETFKKDTKALFDSLQEAWREDISLTQECQTSDSLLLVFMDDMLDHLKTRRHQLGNVNTLLHRQMLDFSKRLGDKSTVQKQCVAKS